MTTRTEAARETAKFLLDIKAVNFRPQEPYMFTSGWASPVYIDCRWVISFVEARRRIIELGVEMLRRDAGLDAVDAVAGGETAGIPYAAWISEAAAKPMLYVRKKPKGFGRDAQIEGHFEEGANVLLVEDLTTDGGSKLSFVDAIRETGATCAHTAVIFYYGIFPETTQTLGDHGVSLHYLCTWHDVLAEAKASSWTGGARGSHPLGPLPVRPHPLGPHSLPLNPTPLDPTPIRAHSPCCHLSSVPLSP